MIKDSEIESLKELLERTKGQLSRKNWKYIHHNSIRNFIFHINKIKDKEKRDLCYDKLNQLLQVTSGLNDFEIEISTGEDLYREFVMPLIPIFFRYKKFVPYAKWDVQLYFLISITLVFIIVGIPIKYLIGLFVAFNIFQFVKARRREVYAIFY